MSKKNALTLWHPTGILRGTVQLPASKSESNRALIIQAICPEKVTLQNLSEAHDTVLLQQLLASQLPEINAEDAGTVMRFLTAYFALTNQQKILTGTARMQQRPIGILVAALRELGAKIKYLKKEGFPPLEIQGFEPAFNGTASLKMSGEISSQFISALLLCAPLLPAGLHIELTGKIASRPYLQMTLALMRQFGVKAEFSGNLIEVFSGKYTGGTFAVEADWSAASYWYSLVALAGEAEITLTGLKENSLQGDSRVAVLMQDFGVETRFMPDGIRLTKTGNLVQKQAIDFSAIPDLAQTFAVLAAAKNVELEMTGLESLRIKETDRIAALQTELAKFGTSFSETKPGTFLVKNGSVLALKSNPGNPAFNEKNGTDFGLKTAVKTYHDHRMAMAFAPLGLQQKIEIGNPEVVRKSYPNFWTELRKVGFEISN